MVLFGICGGLGCGKTLSATYLTFDHWFQRREKIFSNYHLFKIPYFYVDTIGKLEYASDGWFTADELWRMIFSRTPMSKKNKFTYDILGRARKKGVTWCFTAQLLSSMDKMIRGVLDFVSEPKMSSDESYVNLQIFMGREIKQAMHMKDVRFVSEPFYKMYDSICGDQDVFMVNRDGKLIVKKAKYVTFDDWHGSFVPAVDKKDGSITLCPVNKYIEHFVEKDGYEITTDYGRKTKVTGDHSLFAVEGDRIFEKPVREMKVGDHIAIAKNLPMIERDIEGMNVAEKIGKMMKEKKDKYDFDTLAKVSKYFMEENYEEIKKAMVKRHGRLGYKRLYLMRKGLYVPYYIMKDIGKEDEVTQITSRYMKNLINNVIDVDEDLLWLLGLFVAEGSHCSNKYYLRFYTEHKFILKAKRLMKKLFGVEMKTYRKKEKNIWDASISNRCLSILFQELTKDLYWIAQLPKNKLKHFLKGWWDGDGHHNGNADYFGIFTSNEELINPLLTILYRFGLIGSVGRHKVRGFDAYAVRVNGIGKEKSNDVLSWDKGINQNLRAENINDTLAVKIRDIKKFKIKDKVYDFSVEGVHSFIGGNLICKSNTKEEIDMSVEEEVETPKLIFQPHYNPEHGYKCTCKECGTKFFNTWEEADKFAEMWWEKNWKTVFPNMKLQGR